jgi:hypothetical protein
MPRLGSAWLMLAAGLCAAAAIAVACGTDATGVETCREIESARCRQAFVLGCTNINLAVPPHRGSPGTDVEACQQYYDVACLHGLETNNDPGPNGPDTQACLAVINDGGCAVVAHPETSPACAWLFPPTPPPVEAGASDAPTEAAAETGSE